MKNRNSISTILMICITILMASYHQATAQQSDRKVRIARLEIYPEYELRQMLKQGYGAIVNCSSIGGMAAAKGRAPYSATKHGIVGLTQSAAMDYADKGIRINAVCPGTIDTPMADLVTGGDKELLASFIKSTPMGRLGKSEEIAAAVLWLSSDAASYVTGQTLVVDGGVLAQ